jgi:hypothetical protein
MSVFAPADLRRRLASVEARVRAAVERRRETDPDPDDGFRGLYVSESQVDELLAGPRAIPAPPFEPEPAIPGRLADLAVCFGLDAVDVELLVIALAPDVDPRLERLYAYLQDDVSRRRASIGLALELCRGGVEVGIERDRLCGSAPILSGGLVVIEDEDRPFLTRGLRVPDRVTSHLVGGDRVDARLDQVNVVAVPTVVGDAAPLRRAVEAGDLVYIRENTGTAGRAYVAGALPGLLGLDLELLDDDTDPRGVATAAVLEARLTGKALVAGPVDVLARRSVSVVRAFADALCPVVLIGSSAWDPAWSRRVPLLLDAPALDEAARCATWTTVLNGDAVGLDAFAATRAFRLSPEAVNRAGAAATKAARAHGRSVTVNDVHAGARAQNAAGLEKLARRVAPRATWSDLVVPADVAVQLAELGDRARFRGRVLDEWQMGARSSKGRGVTALFAGESGTGKTMSAEVVAADLGLDLYVVDLATVVDKYIGETEKNLDRIFAEADRINGVLLFDEADALFGKRSEVSDAHDRHANVEVAYLLQRMESFDGLAVLTSNLRANLDEAFTRRLDAVVDFPMPDVDDRRRLWCQHLRAEVPRADDIDFDFLAESFRISGGNIRNITLAAAFFAAAENRTVTMLDLVRGTEREYQKLGHLCVPEEFGRYWLAVGERGAL